tara:strand:+ start:361 stop:747 length:387 start_codon:yes stop_codon:yes gene_type:complete
MTEVPTKVQTSLPPKDQKSEQRVVSFFDNYFTKPIEVSANDYDAVIGFFSKRGFDKVAAASVGQALLTQAKLDSVNVFELVDTLKGLTEVQLSQVVAQVLNFQRNKSSTIGFKVEPTFEYGERRNVVV